MDQADGKGEMLFCLECFDLAFPGLRGVMRHDCPIYVEDKVLQSSRNSSSVSEKVNNEELRKWLENLNDEDMGRYKM